MIVECLISAGANNEDQTQSLRQVLAGKVNWWAARIAGVDFASIILFAQDQEYWCSDSNSASLGTFDNYRCSDSNC